MGFFGVSFMVLGFIGALIGVSTSFEVNTAYGEVANLSLMHQQQIVVIISGFLFLAGAVLYAAYLLRLAMEQKMIEHAKISVGGDQVLNSILEENEIKRVTNNKVTMFWVLFLGSMSFLAYIGSVINSGN